MNGARRGRWVRPFVTVLLLGALGAAYLFSGASRGEVNRASGVLAVTLRLSQRNS
ncbi:MAG: hypothetical protein WKF67_04845 [Rubrobacteraceae bacterium]